MLSFPQPERGLEFRSGTEADVMAVEHTFQGLGFQVVVYDNATYQQVQAILRDLQDSREELACLALFVLTHGEENGTLQAKDKPYRLDK